MTQAYNAISNDGTFIAISTINHIEVDGKTISKNKNEHQVISTDAASMLKTSLNAVARYGTGSTANLSNVTTYLKTGTTNDVKDVWTCGFTDDATACIWAGYDTPESLPVYNVNGVWKDLMNAYYNR
jgi:penicillin-binding protein 1A